MAKRICPMSKTKRRLTPLLIIFGTTIFYVLMSGRKPDVETTVVSEQQTKLRPLTRDEKILDQFVVEPPSVEVSLPHRNGTVAQDAVWQTVSSTKFKFFVYSAYLDTRIESVGPQIRIIGTAKMDDPDKVWCRLWYSNSSRTVTAYVHVIQEHWHLKYSAVYVLCKLPPHDEPYPSSVSVVSHTEDAISNEMLVRIPSKTGAYDTDLAVCIKPFYDHYDEDTRLMEFVELNYLLGVRHFTFYNGSVGPKVQCVLDRYKKQNMITVLPWYLDLVSQQEIRTEGQFATFNDCLYRNMYTSKYVAFLDVDEIIVPRHYSTLVELIDAFERRLLQETPAVTYSFANAFFCMEWPDDEASCLSNHSRTESGLTVLHKTRRRRAVHPHGTRSKYVCDPRRVLEAGNHFVWEYLDDDDTDDRINVQPEDAVLHHYRLCEYEFPGNQYVVDCGVHKYKEKLVRRIADTRLNLDVDCGAK